MLMLVMAIACSVAVSILLKLAKARDWQVAQSVLVNYGVASILTLVLLEPQPAGLLQTTEYWPVLLALGVLLPSVFLVMAAAVREAGIARSDAAQRLSLVIPLGAAFLLFGEQADFGKGAGLILALLALIALVHRSAQATAASSKGIWLLPAVWAGYGVIDICFKQVARSGSGFPAILLASFVLAGLCLGIWLVRRQTRWHLPSLAAGLVLGGLNFGNIYAYISAHQQLPDSPALVFTAMNIGVILLGSLTGILVFQERLSRLNFGGMVLAMFAILLLVPL